ncbi:MAG: ABC transporter ATP-binding protein [Oscillospiraceae bacterium]
MNDYVNAIEIKNLSKNFDGFSLNNISFTVPKGSIMGFVGQNGAGKTTTIKSLLNIYKADSGEIKIFGLDSVKHELDIKKNISVVFDEIPFHDVLNATQLDKILKEIYESWNTNTFNNYLERFGLPKKKKISQLSKGMKMKLQIAVALSHNADLLIMDEATGGLDPVVRNEMLDVFMEYIQDENHSILMSSHITSDLEKIADSITFIHNGKILMSGYKDDILENHGVLKCPKDDITKISIDDIVSIRLSNFGAEVMIKDLTSCKNKYRDYIVDKTTLDEILLFYVRGMDKKEWSI